MKTLRFVATLWITKVIAALVQVFFPTRGSNISGKIACTLCPDFLSFFTRIDPTKTVFITGTNGKSTTNNLTVHVCRSAGLKVATNLEGANQLHGVATTLIKNSTLSGRFTSDYLILEVDERNLPIIHRYLPAHYIAVTNIQKDQVQRNGDPDFIYRKIASVIGPHTVVFVNNDEPRSCSLGDGAGRRIAFGVRPNERESLKEPGLEVSLPCPRCHDALTFDRFNVANVGPFHCPSCGFASAAVPDFEVTAVDYQAETFTVAGETFHLGYPAAHFVYNYLLSFAIASELGVAVEALRHGFESFRNIAGRFDTVQIGDIALHYIRLKQENPETLQTGLDAIAEDTSEKVFLFGPEVIHDFNPYNSNTSYNFDCNFDVVVNSGVERYICFGSTICYDAALRLKYAGVPDEQLTILPTDEIAPVLSELLQCHSKTAYLICPIFRYDQLLKNAQVMA